MDSVTVDSPEFQRLLADIAEGARERERDRVPPFEAVDVLRKAGFGALTLPVERGGGGASLRQLLELVLRIAEVDPNLAHIVRNHFVFVNGIARRPHSDLPRWEAEVLGGALFGQGYSEAGGAAGSDLHATTLLADGDGYRLDGTKRYSTGNLYADWLAVRATGPDGDTVTAVVPAHRDGIEHADDWDGIGQQLTGSGTTHFRRVRVEADEVVTGTPGAAEEPTYVSTLPQLYLTTIIAGIVRAIAADAVAVVRARTRSYYHAPSPNPVDDPILQQVVGRLAADAYAAEALVLTAADALDRVEDAERAGDPVDEVSLAASLQAAKAKVVVDDLALRAASNLFDAGGASATTRTADLDRHWRNIRTLASHNPDHYKSRIVGRYALDGTPPPDRAFF